MEKAQEIIRLEDIFKIYRVGNQEVRALDGVSLSVFRNEYVAIMGPSGSGKSTLMNILGCLDSPDSGRYILNGTDVSEMDDGELADVRNRSGECRSADGLCRSPGWRKAGKGSRGVEECGAGGQDGPQAQ